MSILKREYIVIPIIPIGGHLKLNRNQFIYNTIAWNINTKIFKQNGIKKRIYNLKGEIKSNKNNKCEMWNKEAILNE